jgi:hypothetical protein
VHGARDDAHRQALEDIEAEELRVQLTESVESIREVKPTPHGLFVLGETRAWRFEQEELEVLGLHACTGPVVIAGDDALCTTLSPVQRIALAP